MLRFRARIQLRIRMFAYFEILTIPVPDPAPDLYYQVSGSGFRFLLIFHHYTCVNPLLWSHLRCSRLTQELTFTWWMFPREWTQTILKSGVFVVGKILRVVHFVSHCLQRSVEAHAEKMHSSIWIRVKKKRTTDAPRSGTARLNNPLRRYFYDCSVPDPAAPPPFEFPTSVWSTADKKDNKVKSLAPTRKKYLKNKVLGHI